MQSTSAVPWHSCCCSIPNRSQCCHLGLSSGRARVRTRLAFRSHTLTTTAYFLSLAVTNSCSNELEKNKSSSDPDQNRAFLDKLCSSIRRSNITQRAQKNHSSKGEEETEWEIAKCDAISTNMWWADLKAAIGQRINLEGIVCAVGVFGRDRHLAIPHVAVPDIRYIDWAELKRRGFQGVVFDKDNTLTIPYSLKLWNPLNSSVDQCKLVFGNGVAVFSNSAGLHEYDPDGSKARALEVAIGIKVIRHRMKKPAGTAEEIERHFGCESFRLVMVGDRPFTDVVYGNRNGFLTIFTEPLSLSEEPFIVKQVRKLEVALVNRWSKKGLKPSNHGLLPDALECVKDEPLF